MVSRTKNNSAFSLIELSIVVLIIAILIAGVIQSSRLYDQFRVQAAQTLTRSSPVNGIVDLAIWHETSLSESFNSTDAIDGNPVYVWKNINPQKRSQTETINGGNTSYPNSCTTCPTYVANGFNGLPSLRFDGSNDYMIFDGNTMVSTDFTIFLVGVPVSEKPLYGEAVGVNSGKQFFIGGTSGDTSNDNITIGWRDSRLYFWDYQGSEVINSPTLLAYSSSDNRLYWKKSVWTAQLSKTSGRSLWFNGGVNKIASSSLKDWLQSYPGSSIARQLGIYSNMNIVEIIIFQRALNEEERKSVETYLGKKYAIRLNY